jgi:hypothetical protein
MFAFNFTPLAWITGLWLVILFVTFLLIKRGPSKALARWLIPDWRIAWRFASVRAAALLTLLSVLQAEVLPLIRFAVPDKWWPFVTAAFGIAIVLARLFAQHGLRERKAAL